MSPAATLPPDLLARFEAAGFVRVDPGVLQPAEPFLDVMGEEMRRRMFLTGDAAGRELCLRPDFTIPAALAHIARGEAGVGAYFYEGPVFRQGADGGEHAQAGVESFGRDDREAAETEVLALALEACAALGAPEPDIRIGDRAILEAAVDALDAPAAFRRRLKRALAHGASLDALSEDRGEASDHAGLFAALSAAGPEAGRAVIEDLLSLAGIAAVGGRTAGEIADRFLARAEAHSVGLTAVAKRRLAALLAVDLAASNALGALEAVAADPAAGIAAQVAVLKSRLDAFSAAGLPVGRMRFSTRFGRGLDYYDGLVFELSAGGEPLAGGGRYDGLLSALGADRPVPGVGFALWPSRFPGARP